MPPMSRVLLVVLPLLLLSVGLSGAQAQSRATQSRATRRAFERAPLETCLVTPAFSGVEVRVSLVLHRDGTWLVAIDHAADAVNDAAFEACAEALLFEILGEQIRPAPRRSVVLERVVGAQPPEPAERTPPRDPSGLPPHDGRRGAVCSWGEYRGGEAASYPEPRACRAGLSCCYPCGVGGCDSVCQPAEVCESYVGMP